MKKNSVFLLLLVFSVITFFVSCSKKPEILKAFHEDSSDFKTVRIAVQPSAAFIPIYLVRTNSWLEEELKDKKIKIEWQDFESGPGISESLALGKSDIGFLGDVPTITSLYSSNELEIVGIPASGPDAYAILVSRDNIIINSTKDLKGMSIATVFGSTGHNLIGKILKKENLEFSDILLINISAGAAGGILENGGVDAVVLWEPFVTRLIENYNARILISGSKTDLRGTNAIIARKNFSSKNPEVINSILTSFARAVSLLDSISEDELKIISWQFRLTPEQIKKIIKKYDFPVKIEKQDIEALNDTAKFLKSIGVIQREFSVKDYVNDSYYKKSGAEKYLVLDQ